MSLVEDGSDDKEPQTLPVEASFKPMPKRKSAAAHQRHIVFPVRRERITISKQPFVYQDAAIRRVSWEQRVRVTEDVRHERLRIDSSGNLDEDTVQLTVNDLRRAKR
jgi:stress response protein YsnF